MSESQEQSFQLSEFQQSMQSNQQSVIPQQFQVITHMPIFICQFEQFEKRRIFQKLKGNQVRKSQNEHFFDQFIYRRKASGYYKRLEDNKKEAEVLNMNKIVEEIDKLIEQYLKMGYEDEAALQNLEQKLNRKSNQKKMQNFLRISTDKKKKFHITQDSNLSNSQHNRNFEEDPDIEKSFFNRQDNISQFQSLKNVIPKSCAFEEDFFSRTDKNYRKKFNDEIKKDSKQQTQDIKNININNYGTNDISSNYDSNKLKYDKIADKNNQKKVKLNPVNFAFRSPHSNSDNMSMNQYNSEVTNKHDPKKQSQNDVQEIQPSSIDQQEDDEDNDDEDYDDINSDSQYNDNGIGLTISNTKNVQDSESSNDFFDQKFDFDIKYDKKRLKEKGIDSQEFKAVMDSLTLEKEMKDLKKHMKKIEEEDAILNQEINEEKEKIVKIYKKQQNPDNSIKDSMEGDSQSIINDQGKAKNIIHIDDDDDEMLSEQISVKIQSEPNISQNQENIVEVNIYDSQQNFTKLQVPQLQFQKENNKDDEVQLQKQKNDTWEKSSSEQKQNSEEDLISENRQKNFSIIPIQKVSDDKDTFTNSSASRYKRITQSQGKQKLDKEKKESDQEDEDFLKMSQLKLKSLKKFNSDIQNNLQNSVQKQNKNIYEYSQVQNSNEDLDHLNEMSKKFNEVHPHALEQTKKLEDQQQPQLFSFKQNKIQQVDQKQRKMMVQSDMFQQNENVNQQYRTQGQISEQKENTQNIKRHLTLIKNKLKSKQPSKKQLNQSQKKRNNSKNNQKMTKNSLSKSKARQSKDSQQEKYEAKDITSLSKVRKSKQQSINYDSKMQQKSDDEDIYEQNDKSQEEDNIKKEGKQFDYLKRKKKTYQIHKVKWNAKSRVNCWNKQKQKSQKKIKLDHDLEVNFNKVQAKVASLPKEIKKKKQNPSISYINILQTYENDFLPKFSQVSQGQITNLQNTILPTIQLDDFQFNGDFYQIVLEDKKKYKKLLNFLEEQYDYILNN